jgi:hypothetical protein
MNNMPDIVGQFIAEVLRDFKEGKLTLSEAVSKIKESVYE